MQTVCDKIAAFEQHVLHRQLRIARILGQHFLDGDDNDPLSESAFAILSICLSYFEMIEQFATGTLSEKNSGDFFKRGFKKVFPDSESLSVDVGQIYGMLRCGMYHTAMPTKRCGLSRHVDVPIKAEHGTVQINPALFADAVVAHFRQFCEDLRDGCHCELQRNFERMWDTIAEKCQSLISSNDPSMSTTPEPTRYP